MGDVWLDPAPRETIRDPCGPPRVRLVVGPTGCLISQLLRWAHADDLRRFWAASVRLAFAVQASFRRDEGVVRFSRSPATARGLNAPRAAPGAREAEEPL
jgi:hypothetical protein